jgi:hypothetical protein
MQGRKTAKGSKNRIENRSHHHHHKDENKNTEEIERKGVPVCGYILEFGRRTRRPDPNSFG